MIVFYSWQLDLPSKTHKQFLQDCLAGAIKQINESIEMQLAERDDQAELADPDSTDSSLPDYIQEDEWRIVLDQDTQGELGIPAIADTVLEKIEKCDVFVADVTFTAKGAHNSKLLPNANVMLELGYAISKVGFNNVILLMDTAQGPWQKFPFDLQHRRKAVEFNSLSADSAKERKRLTKVLAQILSLYYARREHRSLDITLQAVGPFANDHYRFDVYLTNKSAEQVIEDYWVEIIVPGIGTLSGQNDGYEKPGPKGSNYICQPHNHPSIRPGQPDFPQRSTKKIIIAPGDMDKVGKVECALTADARKKQISVRAGAKGINMLIRQFNISELIAIASKTT